MKQILINVGGKELPCRLTMGALLLFKRNMGKNPDKMTEGDLEELLMLLWCCVVSACKADGVDFAMDFEDFCCHITPADLTAWNKAIAAAGNEQKKTEP